MPSDIFTKILDDCIQQFVNEFQNLTKELFYDKENNLFHPGEYGSYREEIVRKLLRIILYEGLDVAEGFLINIENKHSTQCDLIIYDKKHTPILKDSNKIFVPVETAVGIGEVKSTLSKVEFTKALRKLAENKKLKEKASGAIIKRSKKHGDFNPKTETCDQLFSFLICDKLNFDINNIDYDEIYKNIEYRNRHNLILSVENVLIKYHFDFNLLSKERQEFYSKHKINLNANSRIEFPNFLNANCLNLKIEKTEENPLEHIREFISSLNYGIHNATILDVDIRQYYKEKSKQILFL
jgi:hypothetical protein